MGAVSLLWHVPRFCIRWPAFSHLVFFLYITAFSLSQVWSSTQICMIPIVHVHTSYLIKRLRFQQQTSGNRNTWVSQHNVSLKVDCKTLFEPLFIRGCLWTVFIVYMLIMNGTNNLQMFIPWMLNLLVTGQVTRRWRATHILERSSSPVGIKCNRVRGDPAGGAGRGHNLYPSSDAALCTPPAPAALKHRKSSHHKPSFTSFHNASCGSLQTCLQGWAHTDNK